MRRGIEKRTRPGPNKPERAVSERTGRNDARASCTTRGGLSSCLCPLSVEGLELSRTALLYGAAASFHFALASTFQLRSQNKHRDVTVEASIREANLAEVKEASAEYSVAATILLISWCHLVSSGGRHS